MPRADDSFVFQRVTVGLRKPVVRLCLDSGREVEVLGFHLEPGWVFTDDIPRLIVKQVTQRLYPNETPIIVGDPDRVQGPAFLCIAYLYSDTPTRKDSNANYSALLVCGFSEDIDKGVRGLIFDLLSQVDWEASATDDFMW